MKIGMIWTTAEPYFPKVYITRKYDRDSSMAAAGARGCCVMDLVGDGVSLQATTNPRSLAVLPGTTLKVFAGAVIRTVLDQCV